MKKIMAIGLALSFLLMPVVALAVDITPGTGTDAKVILANIQKWLTGVIGVIAVIFLIIGGLMYITAGGDQNRIVAAKATLTNAVIGIIIILLANAIIWVIGLALGVGGVTQ